LVDHEYLDQVFHESLRLHPPATITNRECTEAVELEGVKGKMYQMKVGDSVMIPIYSIHRDSGLINLKVLSTFIKQKILRILSGTRKVQT
jgi:cytochrome P450